MAQDLVVREGTTVELSDTPSAALQESLQRTQLRTLRDLVNMGVVASEERLHQLLTAAKTVTAETLRRPTTFTPFVAVPGTARTDLRRFGSFLAETQGAGAAHPLEVNAFWRVARAIEPTQLAEIDLDTPIANLRSPIGNVVINPAIYHYLFRNVTVEPHSSLVIRPNIQSFRCGDLLIKRAGRIVVQGSGVVIKAHSIQGEQ
jgi:hypothetical protein